MKKFVKIIIITLVLVGIILGGFAVLNYLNVDKMNAYIDSFGKVEYDNQLVPQYDESGEAYFVTDGEFKVMHLTDVHLG